MTVHLFIFNSLRENMSNWKCCRMPTLVILGVILTIVLVCITGITLINSINISNIVKLREKVASDSAAANGPTAAQTRAAIVEQQYSQLQQHHLSRNDINYLAANHPKILQRFRTANQAGNDEDSYDEFGKSMRRPSKQRNSNKIIIEIGVRNFSNGDTRAMKNDFGDEMIKANGIPFDGDVVQMRASSASISPSSLSSSPSSLSSTLTAQTLAAAIVDGNIDSISVPAMSSAETRRLSESLLWSRLTNKMKRNFNSSLASEDAFRVLAATTTAAVVAAATEPANENELQSIMDSFVHTMPEVNQRLSIVDNNPAVIDFEKRAIIKKMMEHSWRNYKLYAWGKNELRPLSQRPHSGSIFGAYDLGATIVDGLDTLYLMGLDKEYQEGREWIERKLWLDNISADLSVFETNIRFVGGLLTLYAFTGDTMYRDRAQHIADKLLPAFQTPTGIPYALVNTRTGNSKNYGWASGGSSILSELGTLHLEFVYLSDITGNPLYRERVQAIRQVLKEIEKPKGLYPNFLNPKTGKWGQMHMSLGALGDSFFEYLLKAWIQSGQADEEAREMFDEAMVAIIERMVRTSPNGLTYVSDLKFDRLEHKMDHLACFAGGLFALGATTRQNENTEKFMEIGKGLTNTCHESYIRTSTRLGPEAFRFSEAAEARALKSQEKYYILRPETIESYFILWRLTHDQKYRDWGWDAVQALERHCRTPHGYCGIKNVYLEEPQKDDVQQSFFLAETLKYLYLLFSDDSLLPLDEWVFNTEAHPLPIKGANIYYRSAATTSAAAAAAGAVPSNVAAP